MRLATVIALLCGVAICAGIVSAKDMKSDEPEWHWVLDGARAVIPEMEPNDTCTAPQSIACGDVVNPAQISVGGDFDWYLFYVEQGIPITVGTDASDLCDPDAGDTYLELWPADCSARIAYDDDGGPGLYSLISNFSAPYTGNYIAKVRHYNQTSGTGCYKLFVTCVPPATGACCLAGGVCQVLTQSACGTQGGAYQGDDTVCEPNPCPQPPVNDTCGGALPLERCSGGVIEGDLSSATGNYSPTNGCTGYAANGKDVTYVVDVQAGDLVHLVYTTPNHDGSLYVLSDCADMNSCVIGEDDPEPETINWTVAAAGTYYVIADAYASNAGGIFTLEWSITCPPPLGACCLPDGSCIVVSETDCLGQGGAWYGPTAPCDPNPCPIPPQACCFPTGACEMLTPEECALAGGTSVGGTCDPNPCEQPLGACCFLSGDCQIFTEADCAAAGGAWQGMDTVCDPNPCPQPTGACCTEPFYDCIIVTEAECAAAGGSYLGDFTVCEPMPCLPRTACCFPDGHCELTFEFACAEQGGIWQAPHTLCDPNPCPPPPADGACCLPDGACQVLTEEECIAAGGISWLPDTSCDPNPCPPTPTKTSTWGQIKATYR